MHYGYSVYLQFAFWSAIALFSMLPAAMLWFSRYLGKMGNIIKALPVSAILGEFLYTVYHCLDYYQPIPGQPTEPLKWLLMPERLTQLGIYLLFVILLISVLGKNGRQRIKIAALAIPVGLVSALLFFFLVW